MYSIVTCCLRVHVLCCVALGISWNIACTCIWCADMASINTSMCVLTYMYMHVCAGFRQTYKWITKIPQCPWIQVKRSHWCASVYHICVHVGHHHLIALLGQLFSLNSPWFKLLPGCKLRVTFDCMHVLEICIHIHDVQYIVGPTYLMCGSGQNVM